MKVLSTRRRGAAVYRRIEDGDERYTTIEVPVAVLTSLNMARIEKRLEMWERGRERRQKTARIAAAALRGEKATAIAHQEGVTHQAVYALRSRLAAKKTDA